LGYLSTEGRVARGTEGEGMSMSLDIPELALNFSLGIIKTCQRAWVIQTAT